MAKFRESSFWPWECGNLVASGVPRLTASCWEEELVVGVVGVAGRDCAHSSLPSALRSVGSVRKRGAVLPTENYRMSQPAGFFVCVFFFSFECCLSSFFIALSYMLYPPGVLCNHLSMSS